MLPGTSERVPSRTDELVNERIRHQTRQRVAYHARHPSTIERRLFELEREWDIERALEVNGSVLAGLGVFLGATRSRGWLLLPAAVVGFCLQHALHGWCPPLPLLRRLGIRTQREIDEERYALKALRGDFEGLSVRGRKEEHGNGSEAALDRAHE
jgi:hypothetical protein